MTPTPGIHTHTVRFLRDHGEDSWADAYAAAVMGLDGPLPIDLDALEALNTALERDSLTDAEATRVLRHMDDGWDES